MSASTEWIGPRRATPQARALHDDVRAELESHIELAVDQMVEAGEAPDRARAFAERRFGDIDTIAGMCLAEKKRGDSNMKGLTVLLVFGLILAAFGFAIQTVHARRIAAERAMVAAIDARESALERAQARPMLLGGADRPQPGDTVRLTTTGGVEHAVDAEIQVDLGGMVLLPDVGRLVVTDKTRTELEQWVNAAYADYYADLPHVYVEIVRRTGF